MDQNQLGIDVPNSRFEKFYSFKRRLEAEEESFITTPFKNTATFYITFFISLFSFLSLVFQILSRWENIPELIPLLFSQIDSKWILLPKLYIFGYVSIPLIIFILSFTLFKKMYELEKPIALTLLIFTNLIVIGTFIGVTQILSLTTQ